MRYSGSSGELEGLLMVGQLRAVIHSFRHENYRCHLSCSQLDLTVSCLGHIHWWQECRGTQGRPWRPISAAQPWLRKHPWGCWYIRVYTPHHESLLRCQLWKLFPPSLKTNAIETVEFLLVFAALQNRCPLLDFHSKSCVSPGWLGISPLITKKLMNLTQTEQNKTKSSSLTWISGLSFEGWFLQLLFLILTELNILSSYYKWQVKKGNGWKRLGAWGSFLGVHHERWQFFSNSQSFVGRWSGISPVRYWMLVIPKLNQQ